LMSCRSGRMLITIYAAHSSEAHKWKRHQLSLLAAAPAAALRFAAFMSCRSGRMAP
jgi:hypothetical protein